jgi:hypothetical protein
MTELATSNSPHIGQAMLTPSIVVAILSAVAPQMGQSMFDAQWLQSDKKTTAVGISRFDAAM